MTQNVSRQAARLFVERATQLGMNRKTARFTWREVADCLGIPVSSLATYRGNATRRQARQTAVSQ